MPDPDDKPDCAICGQPSDDLNSEGECPSCVEELESEEDDED